MTLMNPRSIPVHPGRMPLDHDLAEVLAEPVDAGQGREGVVDRADRARSAISTSWSMPNDTSWLRVRCGPTTCARSSACADPRGRLGRPDRREPVPAHHEVAGPVAPG